MKRFLKTLVLVILVMPCVFCLSGCTPIVVKGKTFSFKNCSAKYVGSGLEDATTTVLQQETLQQTFANFELEFNNNKEVNLLEDKQIYYFQDSKKIYLFSNSDCTNNYFGEGNSNLKLNVYDDMVVLTFNGYSDFGITDYNYTVTFTEKLTDLNS